MLSDLRFTIGPSGTTIFGVGAVDTLPALLGALGAQRVLLLTDPGVSGAGVAGTVAEIARGQERDVTVVDGVRANPSLDDLDALAAGARQLQPDVIIALGGGSVLDSAKGLALMAVNAGPASQFDYRNKQAHDGVPIIAIPTTAGTGAETNGFGVIEDRSTGRKLYVGHASTVPRHVILDPALTVGVPPGPTAASGVDTMVHALESLSSRRANPYADGLNLQVVRTVYRFLPGAVADGTEIEARAQMLLAAHMAGLAMGTTGLGLGHGIGHALSARVGAPHGVALALILPHILTLNLPVRTEVYARVAETLGLSDPALAPRENAARAIAAIGSFIARLDMPHGLADLGLTSTMIPAVMSDALADEVTLNAPHIPEAEELAALLQAAL